MKRRRTKLEVAQGKVAAAENALGKANDIVAGLEAVVAATRLGATRTEREGKLENAKLKRVVCQQKLDAEKKKLAAATMVTQQKAAAAAAAEAKAAAEVPMDDASMIELVTLRLKNQNKFDNKVDRNENVWETIIMPKFNHKTGLNRSSASLQSKFSKLQGVFKLHANLLVDRAKSSGASAEDVG